MFRSSNPALRESAFQSAYAENVGESQMTIQGTVNKTSILLMVLSAGFFLIWKMAMNGMEGENPAVLSQAISIGMGGAFVGFILALVTIFKKEWAGVTVPLYAFAEGLFLGAISVTVEVRFPGIVMDAVIGTFGVLFSLLFAYKSGFVQATEKFKLGVFAATGGIAIIYLFSFIGSFFGMQIPMIHESGMVGIGFSAFVVIIAALNLVLDFDFIEKGSAAGAPKYMEWYGAFGLLVTLVWLYLEILRLLSKLRSRD